MEAGVAEINILFLLMAWERSTKLKRLPFARISDFALIFYHELGVDHATSCSCPLTRFYVSHSTGSRVPLLKTPIPASYIAVEEAISVIRERCYRDDQTPVLKSEQFRYRCRCFTCRVTLFAHTAIN